jgi:hypothetical protein
MREKPLSECTAKERNERWKESHQSMVRERAEGFAAGGRMSREDAYRKASDMQVAVTNRARAETEGT